MRRSGILAGIIPLAICLPCLIVVLLAAGIGAGAFTAIGAWFSQPWVALAGGVAVVGIALVASFALVVRRARAAACDSGLHPQARAAAAPPRGDR